MNFVMNFRGDRATDQTSVIYGQLRIFILHGDGWGHQRRFEICNPSKRDKKASMIDFSR